MATALPRLHGTGILAGDNRAATLLAHTSLCIHGDNIWSDTGAKIDLTYDDPWTGTDYSSTQIVANREYYNAVSASAQTSTSSPFNGSTGMGFGTLANRPSTCKTSTEGGAGVGYFATDQGAQGTLYTCSATNTWAVY